MPLVARGFLGGATRPVVVIGFDADRVAAVRGKRVGFHGIFPFLAVEVANLDLCVYYSTLAGVCQEVFNFFS